MEHENYAHKGVSNTALGLSIGALGAEFLSGTIGNILNGSAKTTGVDNDFVNRYEVNMLRELTNKDMEIAYLKGREESKKDDLESFKYYDGRIRKVEEQANAQAVINAQLMANISCQQQQIAQLMGLTKTIVPIDNICPSVMPQYNSWVAPTATT